MIRSFDAVVPGPATRWWTRGAGILLALAAFTLGFASPASAKSSWLVRYIDGYNFTPNPPTSASPTVFTLYGTVPGTCVRVSDSQVIDSAHVELRVVPWTACPDSMLGFWAATFDLGRLSSGNHTLDIQLTVERADSGTVVESGQFAFGVVGSAYTPPPIDSTRATGPLVTSTETDPAQPQPGDAVTLIVHGFYPFDCGQASGLSVADSAHVAVTLAAGAACADTSRGYTLSFELGPLARGLHTVDIAFTVAGDTSAVTHRWASFQVGDPDTPPPSDSLLAMLSHARPNPFREETNFSVSLDAPAPAEVAVFDLSGRRVRTVFAGMLARGTTELRWDGRLRDGSSARGGIYFYRLSTPGRVVTRRVVLLARP